ncbi:MAG: MBOAT family protein [Clostridia bacterium]|nr:MBOAT family protein [Clostridia bacterium]
MLFSSIPFLFYFLPCVLVLYFIAPKPLKNSVLLITSLVFYAWDKPKFAIIMIVSIVLGYIFGLLIGKFRGTVMSKVFLALSVGSSLITLGIFKYTDFFISSFNSVSGLAVPLTGIALPIGISFYTFQILSYTVDVYRGDVAAQRNPISLAAYVSMFPQLIAGPIVRYSDIEKQLVSRSHNFDLAAQGIRRFVLGLGKKILIANSLGELCDTFRASDDKSVLFYWLYAIAFTLHIYFDFSGYSDMAIGMGKIFGFEFLENFDYPYISGSVTEFWRRWHMSLGTWFRDYVYIPLGGNRVSKIKWFRNIFVVWFLTGFWHGAAWNFIVWGLYFAILLVLEKLWLKKYLDKSKVLRHVYVMLLVIISFVIFNATDMGEAARYIAAMFGFGNVPAFSAEWLYYLRSYAVVIAAGIIGATPLPKMLAGKICAKYEKVTNVIEPVVLVGLMIVMTAYLVDGSFNPFLYFRF